MKTIETAIKLVLPTGTRGTGTWNQYPEWPPDLFGVTAYLLEQSGAYAWLRPRSTHDFFGLDDDIRRNLCDSGASWRRGDWLRETKKHAQRSPRGEQTLKRLWSKLWSCRTDQMLNPEEPAEPQGWAVWALQLLIVADQASAGIGFFPRPEMGRRSGKEVPPLIPVIALNNFFFPTGRQRVSRDLPRTPYTVGWFLDPELACVLPKTRTPTVGCTIRSLSHHLALIGGSGEVRARWHVNPVLNGSTDVFNLLLIPYPYRINGRSFTSSQQSRSWGLFDVNQSWLPRSKGRVDSAAFCKFALDLAAEAEREVGCLHGIVLPELSLDKSCYRALSRAARKKLPKLRFVISGVHSRTPRGDRNTVRVTALYHADEEGPSGTRTLELAQSKHHRWKLDRDQIYRYSLGDALDPNRYWWENVDVHGRELNFFVFGTGSCFTTLICEDLARVDPVQKVLRAVGPNLVFALLMDGPQLVRRWPGRSCSVLAEDPGSSVLTLTSLGLVERSAIAVKSNSRCVALWRDPGGNTQELDLPPGAHGLCITLSGRRETEYTLDGRGDGGAASYWGLSGAIPLRVPNPPGWL